MIVCVGLVDGELDGVEVARIPGRMVESTILAAPREALEGSDWAHVDHVDHVGYRALLPSDTLQLLVDASNAIDRLELERVALSCRALDGRSAIPTWDELERSLS